MVYANFYIWLSDQMLEEQLQETANYVSSIFVDIVSLSLTSPVDQTLAKTLELPEFVGSDYYVVTLSENFNPITGEKIATVRVFLTNRPTTYRESVLPWSIVTIWNSTIEIDQPGFEPRISISSATKDAIAWSCKVAQATTVGFGVLGGE